MIGCVKYQTHILIGYRIIKANYLIEILSILFEGLI